MKDLPQELRVATRVVHGSRFRDPQTGALTPPLVVSATFDHANPSGLSYGRDHNPTWALLEQAVAELEEGTQGIAFSSGMAAVAAVLELAPDGGAVVVAKDSYTGSRLLLEELGRRGRCQVRRVDGTDLAAVGAAVRPSVEEGGELAVPRRGTVGRPYLHQFAAVLGGLANQRRIHRAAQGRPGLACCFLALDADGRRPGVDLRRTIHLLRSQAPMIDAGFLASEFQ